MLHTLTPMQDHRLNAFEAKHPATRFDLTTWHGACAVIEWSDMEGDGAFAITPSGRTYTMEYNAATDAYELPAVAA
jgi:hypothetical protein